MMDLIVRGTPQELDFVRRVCRDKVRRGVLAILPATNPACDDVVKLKGERDEALNLLKEKEARITELEQQLANATASKESEGDQVNEPADTEAQDEPGKEEEPNVGYADAEEEANPSSEDKNDTKHVEVEDMIEINLDDVKDLPENDVKEAPIETPKKTRKPRSKKSE